MSATFDRLELAGAGLLLSGDRYGLIGEGDRRFRRLLLRVGLPMLLCAVAVPWLRFETPSPKLAIATPLPRSVELLPEPARPKIEPPSVARPLPKAVAAATPAAPVPAVKAEAEVRPDPRQQAAAAGLLRLREQLTAINERSLVAVNQPQALVANTRSNSGSPTLSIAASSAGAGGSAARGVVGQGAGADLGARRTGQVQGGASGAGAGASRAGGAGGVGGAGRGGRGLEDLQLGFDRGKSSLNAIFSRAARETTGIGAGRIVVSLSIAPDGSVTRCELVSSSFANQQLAQKLLMRIRQMNFGARDVPPFSYPNYPIDFLPG